ncbi:unnamed protein product [Cochlearia groenlandica]
MLKCQSLPLPPPSPPDPPDPSSIPYLGHFPPLSSSPSSSSFPPSSSQIFIEDVVLALKAHHHTKPVIVNSQALVVQDLSHSIVTQQSLDPLSITNPNPFLHNVKTPAIVMSISPPSNSAIETPSPYVSITTPSELTPLVVSAPSSVPLGPSSPEAPASNENYQQPPPGHSAPPRSFKPPPSWVDKVKLNSDKSLERLAPVSFAPYGKPRIVIPDSVFEEGAEIHREFIDCRFKGIPPAYTHIQNVLNSMWGKGRKLEIHVNQLHSSMLVRIPNELLRKKIIEKKLWYIGESLFLVGQWGE